MKHKAQIQHVLVENGSLITTNKEFLIEKYVP